ncbi:MAG: GTPase [Candidatus Woesearchaeota archaeon]
MSEDNQGNKHNSVWDNNPIEIKKFIDKVHGLSYVKVYKEIIDTAFSKASKIQTNDPKQLSANKINSVSNKAIYEIRNIQKQFDFDFPKYYREIIDEFYPLDEIAHVFDELQWLSEYIKTLEKEHLKKLRKINKKKTRNMKEYSRQANTIRKRFYGRINSLFKSKKENFIILQNYKKFLNSLPLLMPHFTISIAGYPNVGKSSFLRNLTGSDSEVAGYAFTTKRVMIGYLNVDEGRTAQIIDCPGTLDRKLEEMNAIERQSIITLRSATHKLIFMIDPTYEVKKQINLMNYINNNIREVNYLFLNKIDLLDKEVVDDVEELVLSNSSLNERDVFKMSVVEEIGLNEIKKRLKEDTINYYKNNKKKLYYNR